jgi:hypothetical protein
MMYRIGDMTDEDRPFESLNARENRKQILFCFFIGLIGNIATFSMLRFIFVAHRTDGPPCAAFLLICLAGSGLSYSLSTRAYPPSENLEDAERVADISRGLRRNWNSAHLVRFLRMTWTAGYVTGFGLLPSWCSFIGDR